MRDKVRGLERRVAAIGENYEKNTRNVDINHTSILKEANTPTPTPITTSRSVLLQPYSSV